MASNFFYTNGVHYYISGRYGMFADLNPVAGNILHHSIEMLLKGGLSKSKDLNELKSLGHNLSKIWDAFKLEFGGHCLGAFDEVIEVLHAFEELRYPDKIITTGMALTTSVKGPLTAPKASGTLANVPHYSLSLEHIDKLVAKIFEVTSKNPKFFFPDVNEVANQWLNEENDEDTLVNKN